MSNAIPFEDWLDKQGDDVFLAMCDGHPSTLILVDKIELAVYRYNICKDKDGLNDAMREPMGIRASESESKEDE